MHINQTMHGVTYCMSLFDNTFMLSFNFECWQSQWVDIFYVTPRKQCVYFKGKLGKWSFFITLLYIFLFCIYQNGYFIHLLYSLSVCSLG